MTTEEKQRCSTIMKNHLKTLGWPNIAQPHKVVLQELQTMFNLLLVAGLVKEEDWEPYSMAAQIQYHFHVN